MQDKQRVNCENYLAEYVQLQVRRRPVADADRPGVLKAP